MATRESLNQLFKAWAGFSWKLRTAVFKRWINLQDRFGWYQYEDWIRENEGEASPPEPGLQLSICFGVIILMDENNLPHLAHTIASLSKQAPAQWQAILLCTNPAAVDQVELKATSLLGERLGLYTASCEKSPAQNLLDALQELSSEWITFISSGDSFSPGALGQLSSLIEQHPDSQILYTDEDHVNEDGKRHSPFFKPDWSPELLLSHNYLLRAFYRKDLLVQALRQSDDLEEAIFRCAESAQLIIHLPAPLVHINPISVTDWLHDTPLPAQVAAHLQRCGIPHARVSLVAGQIRAIWPLSTASVSIIIPTRDQAGYLEDCIRSIQRDTVLPDYEIVLVDSGSRETATHNLYQELKKDPHIFIVNYTGRFNFSAALNLGAKHAKGNILIFLNNDTKVLGTEWMEELVRWAQRPTIGIVGAKLLSPDRSIQHAGIIIGMEGHASHVFGGMQEGKYGVFGSPDWYRNYSAITAACMATRREVFESVGGFDENYELVFSDVEICQRTLHKGYRVVYTPYARLIHYEGQTRRRYIPPADIHRGAGHFAQLVNKGDPYYNPNLSYAVKIPTLRRLHEEAPIDRLENIVRYA